MVRHFKVKIDHDSLKHFFEQGLYLEEQRKWVTNMLGYDFEIMVLKLLWLSFNEDISKLSIV